MKRIAIFGVLSISLALVSAARGAPATAEPDAALPYRAVLPAIASGGTLADNSASPNAELVVANISQRLDGGLVVAGEVVNNSATSVTAVTAEIAVTTDREVVRQSVQPRVQVIAPGETGPFQVYIAGVTALARSVEGHVTAFAFVDQASPAVTFAFSGPYPFQIGPPDAETRIIPYSTVIEEYRGAVTNRSGARLARLEAIMVVYDAEGRVIAVTSAPDVQVPFYEGSGDPVLEPGFTGSFSVGLPIAFLLTVPGELTFRGFLNAEAVP